MATMNRVSEEIESLAQEAIHVPAPLREWWLGYLAGHREHYETVLSLIPGDTQLSLLEVGCVPGQLSILLAKTGRRCRGIDLAPERMGELWKRNDIDVQQADVETDPLPFPDASLDIVLFTELIEHLRINPLHALREAGRVLKSGGILLLSTPNITPIDRLRFLFGRDYQGRPSEEFRKLETIGHMGHIRLYSLTDIRDMLHHAGLRELDHSRHGHCAFGPKARLLSCCYPVKSRLRARLYVRVVKDTPHAKTRQEPLP